MSRLVEVGIESGSIVSLSPGEDIVMFEGGMMEEDFYFLLIVTEYGWEKAAAFERWRIRV